MPDLQKLMSYNKWKANWYLIEPSGIKGFVQDSVMLKSGVSQDPQVPISMSADPRLYMATRIELGTSYQGNGGKTQVDME